MRDPKPSTVLEIRDFAERVLFSASLQDKLWSPESLSDHFPGRGLRTQVKRPAREGVLKLHSLGENKRHKKELRPSIERLHAPKFRARLLHTFAHHELISLELMALALLRFPEAPKAFRRGLAQVLIDEQRHFKLYHERVLQLGLELGEEPVSDYFWRCVADAPDLPSFNGRLALVFEQANIDFTRHYAPLFREVGDIDSAAALDVIYEDEISHVGLGLHWFRRWRPSNEPEWDSFCKLLEPPLSPGRARGPVYSSLGRRQAGFSEDFIRSLQLWGGSTGRPPVVWYGNFDYEEELIDIEVSKGLLPLDKSPKRRSKRRHTRQSANEAFTPALAWLTKRGDIVHCPYGVPSDEFQALLMKARSVNPEWVTELSPLIDRSLGGVSAWGWSPQAQEQLSILAPAILSSGEDIIEPSAVDKINESSSKLWDLDIRRKVMSLFSERSESCPLYAPNDEQIKVLNFDLNDSTQSSNESLDLALDRWIKELSEHTTSEWICKRFYGSAGRGIKRLNLSVPLDNPTRGWLRRSLPQGLIAEPLVDRVADLSFHGVIDNSGIRYDGEVLGLVDDQGQFIGAHVGPPNTGLNVELKRFLNADGQDRRRMSRIGRTVVEVVGASLSESGFRGYFGVDALILKAEDYFRIYPLVEVNPRLTMGRIALVLRSLIDPKGERGIELRIFPNEAALCQRVGLNLNDIKRSLTGSSLDIQWDENGRWKGHVLPLTDLWSIDQSRENKVQLPIIALVAKPS